MNDNEKPQLIEEDNVTINVLEEYNRNKRKNALIGIAIIVALVVVLLNYSKIITIYKSITNKDNITERYDINDSGVQEAIQSDFIQDVGSSDEYDGLTFTVDHIVADGKRLILLYTIENTGNHEYMNDLRYEVLDEEGNRIPALYQYPDFNTNLNEVKQIHNNIDLVLSPEMEIPSSVQVDIKLIESPYSRLDDYKKSEDNAKELPYTWSVQVPIDKEKFRDKKIDYAINNTVEIEDQKIYIDRLIVYPTITVLDIRYDKNNTMDIFSIQDIKISDGEQEWTNGVKGLLDQAPDEFTRRLYFESNYFSKDKKDLFVLGSGIRGIQKDKRQVIVDIEKSQLLKSPDDKLKLSQVNEDSNEYELVFNYYDGRILFDFEFIDSNGNTFSIKSIGSTGSDEELELFYKIPKEFNFKSPITLTVADYSNIIEKPFKIKVIN